MFEAILVAFITAMLGPTVVEYFKSKFSKSKKNTFLGEAIENNELIDKQLELIIDELNCDGIRISQFHNGGNFYPTGKSIQKFSIFHELTSEGTLPIQQALQNIPVSLFSSMFSKLYKDGELFIHDFSIDEDHGLASFSKQFGIKSCYLLSLIDLNDNFIGVLTITYNKKKHKLDDDQLIFLRNKAGTLGAILTNYLINKK